MINRAVFSSLITRRRGKIACPPQCRNGLFDAGREKLEKQPEQGTADKLHAAAADDPRE